MEWVYNYCTDFIINLANLLELSYYEINWFLFCVLYPILILSSFIVFIIQVLRLRKVRRK